MYPKRLFSSFLSPYIISSSHHLFVSFCLSDFFALFCFPLFVQELHTLATITRHDVLTARPEVLTHKTRNLYVLFERKSTIHEYANYHCPLTELWMSSFKIVTESIKPEDYYLQFVRIWKRSGSLSIGAETLWASHECPAWSSLLQSLSLLWARLVPFLFSFHLRLY